MIEIIDSTVLWFHLRFRTVLLVLSSLMIWIRIDNPAPISLMDIPGTFFLLVCVFNILISRNDGTIWRHPSLFKGATEFRQQFLAYSQVSISLLDSIRSGNCILGSLEFARRAFPGRRSITVGELLPYCRIAAVRQVIAFKLER